MTTVRSPHGFFVVFSSRQATFQVTLMSGKKTSSKIDPTINCCVKKQNKTE